MRAETSLWQESWAILAQAWRPPMTAAQCDALRGCLASDLRSLAEELTLDLATEALAERLAELDDQTLLVAYSRLFLVPPCAAHLDLGNGVNGEQMGPYAQAMARTLAELGLEVPEDRHEHPDYLPVALEVTARLESDSAPSELRLTHLEQVLSGLLALRQALARHAAESAWYLLAVLTESLLRERLARLGVTQPGAAATDGARQRHEQREALSASVRQDHHNEPVPQAVASHAQRNGVPPEALLEMIEKLEAEGLDASHLRGQLAGDGWSRLRPPEAKRGRTSNPRPSAPSQTGSSGKA